VTIRLAGRDAERLTAVARACSIVAGTAPLRIEQFGSGHWNQALTGSDVVLVQIRPGYYDGRHFDERFPLAHGIPGDEGIGPGGLSAAHRAWPELKSIFEKIRAYAPGAFTILLSSPGSLLVRLANRLCSGWPLVGVCELPLTTLKSICSLTGRILDRVTFDYTGINHLGWLYNVSCEERNLLTSCLNSEKSGAFPSALLISTYNGFPLKYLRLHFERSSVVREQQTSPQSRAVELSSIATSSFETFRSGNEQAIRHALRARSADWYPQAVVPLLKAYMHEEGSTPLFLSVASASGDVRECCYYAQDGNLCQAASRSEPSPQISELTDSFIEYERVAAAAVLNGREDALTEALIRHPWIGSSHCAALLARDVHAYSRAYWERAAGGAYV
jgi:6-phospho-beta-glucosidase